MQGYVKYQNEPNLGGKKHGNSKLDEVSIHFEKGNDWHVKLPLIWVYEAVRLWKLCWDDSEIVLCLALHTTHK